MRRGKNKTGKWEEEELAIILDPVSITEVPLKERPKGGEEPVEQLSGEELPRRTVSP